MRAYCWSSGAVFTKSNKIILTDPSGPLAGTFANSVFERGEEGAGGAVANVVAMRHEIVDLLRLAVLNDFEVVLRESVNKMAGGIVHHDIDVDEAGGDVDCIVGGGRRGLCESQSRGEQNGEQTAELGGEHEPHFCVTRRWPRP